LLEIYKQVVVPRQGRDQKHTPVETLAFRGSFMYTYIRKES